MKDQAHWARFAEEWIAWARSPGHDVFWRYRRGFARFVGLGTGHTLEVGCGEGRISRELKTLGYRVTATDVVATLIEASRQANSADEDVVADGKDLPFKDEKFDLVMAYNVLMDVEDVPAMHFAGWSQPLENYMAALEGAGLAITPLREPVPDEASADDLKQWARVPLFLWLKARILK
jgi:2-polyprenyl-3-methyl-5-hydroxy-6-metoxy-1,4-benzoquinol methylase